MLKFLAVNVFLSVHLPFLLRSLLIFTVLLPALILGISVPRR